MSPGALTRFLIDPLKVDPSGRMPSMLLQRDEAASLAAHLVQSRNADFEKPIEEGDAKRGEELVKSTGCLSCHTLEIERKPLASASKPAPELSKLDTERGCLSQNASASVPKYAFKADDRAALISFV